MAIFADRTAAGRELAESLSDWRGTDAVVLGIARGGVVVAAEVARTLGLALDVAVVRKLGRSLPRGARGRGDRAGRAGRRSCRNACGRRVTPSSSRRSRAVSALSSVVGCGLFPRSTRRARRTRGHRRRRRRGHGRDRGRRLPRACVPKARSGSCSRCPSRPSHWWPEPAAADEFVCPHRVRDFWAVGQFYDDFTQTEDEEVARLLSRASTGSATGSDQPGP